MSGEQVLVTGGSGFVGAHSILQLFDAGYTVKTTVRSLAREPAVRAMLEVAGAETGAKLSFLAADLTDDAGWAEAVADTAYVLHVASPFPTSQPKNEDDLIIPARGGTSSASGGSRREGQARRNDVIVRGRRLRLAPGRSAVHRR